MNIQCEVNKCLHCKNPQCREGCPVRTNIPEILRLLEEEGLDAAGSALFENNPLSAICSIVCDHEKQCQGHCVLNKKNDPVHFSEIEKYISSAYLGKIDPTPEQLHKNIQALHE